MRQFPACQRVLGVSSSAGMDALSNQFRVPWPAGVPFPSFDEQIAFGEHHFGVLVETKHFEPKNGDILPTREAVFLMFSRLPLGD